MYRDQVLIHFVMLLVSQTHATVKSTVRHVACNSQVSLECGNGATERFSAVAWHRIGSGTDVVLFRMDKGKPAEVDVKAAHMKLSKNKSLIISAATPADSGAYRCKIYASVGEKNAISVTNLTVQECPETTLMTTLTTSETAMARLSTGPEQRVDRRDVLTTTWTVGAFSMVVFCKIALSLAAFKVRRVCASARQADA